MNESNNQRKAIPWWLWPNVLNLDAPLVAVVWQEMFARVVGAQLGAEHRWLIFLAVWQVYFVDRWLDSRRDPKIQTDRHRFHGRIGAIGWVVEAAAFVASIVLAIRCLNQDGWVGAAVLLLLSGVCFTITHLGKSRWYLVLPKELWIGAIFACGCALQPWTLAVDRPEWSSVWIVLFAALCFLNCAAITFWESQPADRENPRSLLNQWPRFAGFFPVWCGALGLLAFRLGGLHPGDASWFAVSMVTFLGALGLLVLNRLYASRRARALCVLADVVLLAPLPWILVL
jgi:hypothetical protein